MSKYEAGKISVVIPLYNKRDEIRRCLLSVAAQTVQPGEVIIVDDGSTDGSAEIAASTGCPGLRIIAQANQGAAAARNTGIRAAAFPLIAFIDGDDEWHPEFLSEILLMERSFPQAAAFTTALVTDKGRAGRFDVIIPVKPVKKERSLIGVGEGFEKVFSSPAAMWSSSIAIRRMVFDTVGFFRTGVRQVEDIDMWFRIACVFPVAYSKKVRATWHWTAANRSSSLAPSEDYSLNASLTEVMRRCSVAPPVVRKAERWARRFNFILALSLARWDPAKGLRALEEWRRRYGTTLSWYMHYVPLAINPKAYWQVITYGAGVKNRLRTVSAKLRTLRTAEDPVG